jgi:hypothetical protein
MIPASQSVSQTDHAVSPQELIERIAERVVEKRFSVPVIFLLEMHKPLTGLFHAGGVAFSPLLSVLCGAHRTKNALQLFESRESIEALLKRIETLEMGRRG